MSLRRSASSVINRLQRGVFRRQESNMRRLLAQAPSPPPVPAPFSSDPRAVRRMLAAAPSAPRTRLRTERPPPRRNAIGELQRQYRERQRQREAELRRKLQAIRNAQRRLDARRRR